MTAGRTGGGGGVHISAGARDFHFIPALWPTGAPIHWAPGAFPPAVKRPGRQADHSSLSVAEVKNE
jgi:hypothetical protein